MLKWLKAMGVAAILSLPWALPVSAAALEGGNFTAVDAVSTGVCTSAVGEAINLFGNGTYDMVVALQVEKGSPGSGAWELYQNNNDVFPDANTTYSLAFASDAPNQCFRLRVTTDTSGTLYFTTVTDRDTPTQWGSTNANLRTNYRAFDEFHTQILTIANAHDGIPWLTHEASDADATVAIAQVEPEGAIEMGWGDAATDANNTATVGYDDLSAGALVSDGLTVFEIRAHPSQVTSFHIGVGLSDIISVATEAPYPDVVGTTITEGPVTTMVNIAAWVLDFDQTTDEWGPVAMNGNTIQNNAVNFTTGVTSAATTYQTFRIEVDSSGDALFYHNGVLEAAFDSAVATTAVLIPYVSVTTTSTVLGNYVMDYVDFWAARPSG